MTWLTNLYKGNYSLSKSYWLFGNIIPILLFIPIFLIIFLTSDDPMTKFLNQDFAPEGFIISIVVLFLSIVTLIYIFISIVGIWRSSQKYQGRKIWSILAKITIIIGGLLNVKSFFKFF